MSLRHVLLLALVLASPSAAAAEGVFQISQACVADGCFAGDDPGWPVQIRNAGSYRLVSNLDLSDAASPAEARAITIDAPGVTLDLNGFALVGGITCTGAPVTSCSAAVDTGHGISSSHPRTTIRNGSVRGFSAGVSCFSSCNIEQLQVEQNAGSGISTNNAASLVRDSIASRNGGDGFFAVGRLSNNVAEHNGRYGLFMNPRSIGEGNVVRSNGGNGVRCFSCLLVDNLITGNVGFGIEFSQRASWKGNLVSDNLGGTTTGAGSLQLGTNRCDAGACP